MKTLTLALVLIGTLAHADTKYIDSSGKTVSKGDVVRALLKDANAKFFKVQEIELNEKKMTLTNKRND